MKVVYAITGGGSTLDILGVFEDRALADALLADWREHMGVYDDGWDIQELAIWDRLPTHWTYWKMNADSYGGFGLKVKLDKEEIYEWGEQKSRETIVKDYSARPQHSGAGLTINLWVYGADLNEVRRTMYDTLRSIGAPAVAIP